MSKGSRQRPYSVPLEQRDATFETIFGKKPPRKQYVPPPLPEIVKETKKTEWVTYNKEDEMTPSVEQMKQGTCGCGRSPTGDCIGWHGLTERDYQVKLAEYIAEKQGE